jgi:hypothetical protein
MALIAKQNGNNKTFEPVPSGVHMAVCYSVIDLGVHYSEKYGKSAHKVLITWEIPEETIQTDEGEKPRVISKQYTISLHEKAVLRQHLEAWRNKPFTEEELAGFDLKKVLGTGCQLQVMHRENNGKTYAEIASIMALPKGFKMDKPVNKMVYFEMSDGNATRILNEMASLHDWQQQRIKESETYKELVNPPQVDNKEIETEDDEPYAMFDGQQSLKVNNETNHLN